MATLEERRVQIFLTLDKQLLKMAAPLAVNRHVKY